MVKVRPSWVAIVALVSSLAAGCGSASTGARSPLRDGAADVAADAEYSDSSLYSPLPSAEATACGTPGGTCHHLAQLGGSVTPEGLARLRTRRPDLTLLPAPE